MTAKRKISLLCVSLVLSTALSAQIEVTHLFSKGLSATGFGAFLRVGVPIASGDEISGDLGFQYFSTNGNNLLVLPLLAGYRHYFDGSGSGLYLEPMAGYSFGATDIQKTDQYGNGIYDGSGHQVDVKISGATAGLGFGYLIPSFPLNLGLRYIHLFVSGDQAQNIVSFRVSYALAFARREK
jgi:hypothetical protein